MERIEKWNFYILSKKRSHFFIIINENKNTKLYHSERKPHTMFLINAQMNKPPSQCPHHVCNVLSNHDQKNCQANSIYG